MPPSSPSCSRRSARLRFELDMNSRLDLDLSVRATEPGPRTPREETAAAPA